MKSRSIPSTHLWPGRHAPMVEDEADDPRNEGTPPDTLRVRREHELGAVAATRSHEVIREEERTERHEEGTDQEQEHLVSLHREQEGEQERDPADEDRQQRGGRARNHVQRGDGGRVDVREGVRRLADDQPEDQHPRHATGEAEDRDTDALGARDGSAFSTRSAPRA